MSYIPRDCKRRTHKASQFHNRRRSRHHIRHTLMGQMKNRACMGCSLRNNRRCIASRYKNRKCSSGFHIAACSGNCPPDLNYCNGCSCCPFWGFQQSHTNHQQNGLENSTHHPAFAGYGTPNSWIRRLSPELQGVYFGTS